MRRLNIVPMNKVIPSGLKLPKLDKVELCRILQEVFRAGDLKENSNELAITLSPMYRFLTSANFSNSYSAYQDFCLMYGFRCMNITNFEVKKKFVDAYINKCNPVTDIKEEDMPF